MLKETRQKKIIDLLSEKGSVTIPFLSSVLNVSDDTIRRDLHELNDKNILKRVRNGAVRLGPPITNFHYRETIRTEMKHDIALKLLKVIKPNSTILIDGSTSNLEFVKIIPKNFVATFITNSPPIAIELSSITTSYIHVIGGELYKNSMVNLGVEAYKQIKKMHFDTYIMGIYNIDMKLGTSVPTQKEALIKRAMLEQSDNTCGIVTNDKFETVGNFYICNDLQGIDIYTKDMPEELLLKYRENKINVFQ